MKNTPASNRFRARVGNDEVYIEMQITSDIYTALRKIFLWARNSYSDLKDELVIDRWNSLSREWIEEERIPITLFGCSMSFYNDWSFDPFYEYHAELNDPCWHWFAGLQKVYAFHEGMILTYDNKLVSPSKVLIERTAFQKERLVIPWANKKYNT